MDLDPFLSPWSTSQLFRCRCTHEGSSCKSTALLGFHAPPCDSGAWTVC
uniref:Uncharacterized protein n=1 Tax=Anguilla anguilla TaxID=7936 RepID=A0A0E9RVR5_ANGAN